MDHNDTVQSLVALANNGAASMEERRTAAFQAVTIMHRRNVSGEPDKPSFDHEFERRRVRISIDGFYMALSSKVYEVLNGEFGHPAEDASGYAELNRLCFDLAGLTGDILFSGLNFDKHLAEMKESLRFVAAAFKDWESTQAPSDAGQLRAALIALFDADPVPDSHLNTIAARLHYPVPAVQAMLDQLVAEGLLRLKGKANYSKVKRPRKAKAA